MGRMEEGTQPLTAGKNNPQVELTLGIIFVIVVKVKTT